MNRYWFLILIIALGMMAVNAFAQSESINLLASSSPQVNSAFKFNSDFNHSSALYNSSVNRPLFFTENKGQWDDRVLFKAEGAGGLTWWIENDGVTLLQSVPDLDAEPLIDPASMGLPEAMRKQGPERYPNKGHALKFRFRNALPRTAGKFLPEQTTPASAASVESSERLSWNNNYFLGNDPDKWAPNCGNFQRVALKDVWTGVDVVWRSEGKHAEFDFLVHPGADPGQIRVECSGLTSDLLLTTEYTENTELLLQTSLGALRLALPEAFQIESDGSLSLVRAEFKVEAGNSFGVCLPEGHDPNQPLIIDPLVYSTYLGTQAWDFAFGLASVGAGRVVVAGWTESGDFPTTEGVFDRSINGNRDVFVTLLSPDGSELLYSTFLGGGNGDYANALISDGAGGVIVAGYTASNDFPITGGAYQENYGGYSSDAFITRLNADGNALIYSTFLGGDSEDYADALTLDGAGGVVVAGHVGGNFPTTEGAYQENYGGGYFDAFITRLNADGSALIYSTYLGGDDRDWANAITSDGAGGVVVAGMIWDHFGDFPTTEGAFDRSFNGGVYDAFVARLSRDGSELLYSTYLGGNGDDKAYALTRDGAGGMVVAGMTVSEDFPTTEGAFDRSFNGGVSDAFVVRLSRDGSELLYSTYLGGNGDDGAYALARDGADGVVMAGGTGSDDFPTTEGVFDRSFNGGQYDAFIARLNVDGSELLYSTYLGGEASERAWALAPDNAGGFFAAGETYSDNFPVTNGAYQSYPGGMWNAFVTRIDSIGLAVGEEPVRQAAPSEYYLAEPYPNPFNSATSLTFGLSTKGHVKLAVYDLNGKLLEILVNDVRGAGTYSTMWNASAMPSGLYLARLESEGRFATQKLMLVR
jgi:hypothetical protein